VSQPTQTTAQIEREVTEGDTILQDLSRATPRGNRVTPKDGRQDSRLDKYFGLSRWATDSGQKKK
jgi:hypothetical protein